MMSRLFIAVCLVCCVGHGSAAGPCPRTDLNAEWSARCFQTTGATRKVKGRFVNRLRSAPTTILISETRELLAVDARGRVILPNIVYTGDFDRPNPDGIGRYSTVTKTGRRRCGYFREKTFDIIVAAQFDQCTAFANGRAQACVDCVARCVDEACHDRTMAGGRGVELDTAGRFIGRFEPGAARSGQAAPFDLHHATPLPVPSTSTGVR